MSVRVVAMFEIKPEHVDEFIAAAVETLVKPTHAEDGCLAYQLCQDQDDPGMIAMIEEWRDDESLDRHLAEPRLHQALAELEPMMDAPPVIARFNPLSAPGPDGSQE
jgi:quinol monooxygenase YgiN